MGIGRMMGKQGMNIHEIPDSRDRGRVLQMLWNFVSILVIVVLLVQWPDAPTERRWPSRLEIQEWCGADMDGKLGEETDRLYGEKWELMYGVGTEYMREGFDAEE